MLQARRGAVWWVDFFLRAAITRDLSTFAPSED
jgi:hypothetical protein